MKSIIISNIKRVLLAAAAASLISAGPGSVAIAQNFSPGVMDVGKLAAAHVPEDTIINYIKGSGINYHLSPDDIIYLSGQGVTPHVMALLQSGPPAAPAPAPAPSEPPPTPAPPPADASAAPSPNINLPYFQTQLT